MTEPNAWDVFLSWFQGFEKQVAERFDRLENRLDQKLTGLERRVDLLEDRMAEIDTQAKATAAILDKAHDSRRWRITTAIGLAGTLIFAVSFVTSLVLH